MSGRKMIWTICPRNAVRLELKLGDGMKTLSKLLPPALVGVVILASTAVADTSPDRRGSIRLEEIAAKLDILLRRVEALEKRIAGLEKGLSVAGFRVDEHGILRDLKGQPGGFWGIDNAPAPNPVRR